MERIKIEPREGWQTKVEKIGFNWHSIDGVPYWDESAFWRFSESEINHLEQAAEEGYQMVLEAVGRVIEGKELPLFGYTPEQIALIEKSWEDSDNLPHIYGRFDFAFDGTQAKILEFNADTPTSLFEASVVQWYWLQERFPEADQFNSIHEKMVRRMQEIDFAHRARLRGNAFDRAFHVTCVTPHAEDQGTVSYIEMCASEAGVPVKFVPLTEIGWKEERIDGVRKDAFFTDLEDKPISTLFKLVPWEWLLADEFGKHLIDEVMADQLTVIEPAWKMVASNKRLLATMWEMYPYHPLLLPTYSTADKLAGKAYVKKPVWGREGQNVSIIDANNAVVDENEGVYSDNQFIFQEKTELMQADGNFAIIGGWVIDGYAAGIGIRESKSAITNNEGRFLPHLFE